MFHAYFSWVIDEKADRAFVQIFQQFIVNDSFYFLLQEEEKEYQFKCLLLALIFNCHTNYVGLVRSNTSRTNSVLIFKLLFIINKNILNGNASSKNANVMLKKRFFVWFRLVLSSIAIINKAKEKDTFLIIKNITITVSTLSHMLKSVKRQYKP